MGRSDSVLTPWYKTYIKPEGDVALLGFTDHILFSGDLYDIQLGNWDINTEWSLPKQYDTIISLRCPYFAKDPEDFIHRCQKHLKPGGTLYADWGLGDHWRFENYKVGWVKDGEHEYAYGQENFLWSSFWDDSFVENQSYREFSKAVEKFGYHDVRAAVYEEVPNILDLTTLEKYFIIQQCNLLKLWNDSPQLYILMKGTKK